MQEDLLFEYAVIRVVPRVEREEFINVGVILFCSKQKFLQTRFVLKEERVLSLHKEVDIEQLKENLWSFERICKAGSDSGPIGKLTHAERFRWLTATRSSVVQCSKVHPGLCKDAQETLEKLFEQLVL
ncbi:DUF3037 domain-containing protein [Desertivirga xinjiangensis]|uniref:DUF3037 domain-containing protein n=1 Tax=Desertivirga xinjiangensis TaxID=539206 RepID=UPI002108A78A|nr:DUF3037 domain-containing protein [Pedobacter xinjiangensis]